MKLKRSQNPGGHKKGRASFPIQSQYKVSKIHTPNPNPREEKGGGTRERGRSRQGEGVLLVLGAWLKEEREREGVGRGYLSPTTPELKD